ncbi:hypothetical protein H6F43_01090 [Leptolyngbya sp. FACHB-36]|uniref:hypothetical protein n=1 Tax=Leptolyngbya sp. FACHB-36 TaxID=2692808 RepID=UPI0016810643|nr:hypothetical protein [Leptolyngbya sp. FACHB-36]MBD2018778.1 hypothetical protein [Leptolyngbya sp. FACHB-36]
MVTAVLNNHNLSFEQIEREIRHLPRRVSHFPEFGPQGQNKNSSKFVRLCQTLNELADSISRDWHQMQPEEREQWKRLAYSLVREPEHKNFFYRLVHKVRFSVQVFVLIQRGEVDALLECVEALDRLIDNIFDAIEREDPLYQKVLTDTLEELKTTPAIQLGPEDTREWLRSISSGADEEV